VLYVVIANHTSKYVYEREVASCPDAYFLVVIIIEDTSRVSNIYTKQVVQNTEDYFINQFSYMVYFIFFRMKALISVESSFNSMACGIFLAWL
jgi:hypothetical protein